MKTIATGDQKSQEEFKTTNLYKFKGKVTDSEFKDLADIQGKLRKGSDDGLEQIFSDFRSRSSVVNNALKDSGVDITAKPGSKDASDSAKFRKMVDERVTSIETDTKKKVTPEELQKITTELLIPQFKRGGIFGQDVKVPYYQYKKGDELNIPEGTIPAIQAQLRLRGMPSSFNDAIKVYITKMGGLPNGE